MPDNCCVLMCCKTGYRVDADGSKVTYHCLSIKDPSKLKVYFGFQKYNFLSIFGLWSCLKYSCTRIFAAMLCLQLKAAKKTFAHEVKAICAT